MLGDPDKKIIGQDIKSIEFGWPRDYQPPTLVKNLHGKVNEVRSNISDGRIARVLFAVIDQKMVLLHGFVKKSQKTPKADLDLAKSRLRDYERG